MTNSIWKTPDQKPEITGDIIYTLENGEIGYFFYMKGKRFPTSCAESQFHWGSEAPINMTKWCWLSDLIDQADKAERLQKAVDKALHYLDAEYHAYIMVHQKEPELIATVLKEIKQLIKE